MVESAERRACQRVSFAGITVILAGPREICCMADNLSESGMLLFPIGLSPPQPGPFFRVTFTFPFATDWVEIGATLARSALINRRPAWGVKFTEVPGNAKALLQQLVAERSPPSPAVVEPGPGTDVARSSLADVTREVLVDAASEFDNAWFDEIEEEDTARLAADAIAPLRERSKKPVD